jgi:HAE1 family hydrophobic/amphiphilic exporter-1
MNLISLSVQRPVLTTMMVFALVVLGGYAYLGLSVDLFPDIDFPYVTVTTTYPGAGPDEVETQVTDRIEDAVSTLANVDQLESISRESVSFVIIRFELEADPDAAASDVRARVDAIVNDLPDGADKPIVEKFEIGSFPIVSLAVSSDRGVNAAYQVADETIRDRLSQIPGVATIDIIGGQRREIQVAVSRKKLEHYDISIGAVTAIVAAENVNIPDGRITARQQEYIIRTLGEFATVDQIRRIPVALPDGGSVFLSEIADVRDTFEEARSVARFNEEAAVEVDVIKRSGANTIDTADGIYRAVDALRSELPHGMTIEYASDDSRFIRAAVKDVTSNIMIGILLTAGLLFLFLRDYRGTLIAAVVMPSAIVATFLLMQFAGFTLNLLSLLALGVSVGVLVTNSIVVLENILRHLQMGKAPAVAAQEGTKEVALAVIASVMTNVVVFVPIAFMKGIIGRFFLQFGMTVVFATVFSLFISFTLTPMLSAVFLKGKSKPRPGDSPGAPRPAGEARRPHFMERLMNRMAVGYRALLEWSLSRKRNRAALIVGAVLFLLFSFVLLRVSGGEFMPVLDEGYVSVTLELPVGSSLAMTEAAVSEAEEIIRSMPEVESVISSIGGSLRGINQATLRAKLVDISDRKLRVGGIINKMRPLLASIPEADVTVAASSSEGGGENTDIQIEIMGDNTRVLRGVADSVTAILSTVPGLVDLDSSWKEGGPELVFLPNREQISSRGLTTGAVATVLRNSFEGDDRSVFREAGEEYKIRVQFDDKTREDPRVLRELRVHSDDGLVPLIQLGSVDQRRGAAEIHHRDRQKRITVTANLAEGTITDVVRATRPKFDAIELPAGYKIVYGGMYEFQEESFASLFQAMGLATILTYVVLAMILESFFLPFTVMLTLPLGLVGASMGLFFGGQTVNIFSLMAMVMLIGIVVNNAILLLDYVTQVRRRGVRLHEAILEGCPARLRAVVMTNLAIAVGMIPQALGTGQGYELRLAIAMVTMGGVLISAVFTLIIIPSLYAGFEELKERMSSRRQHSR